MISNCRQCGRAFLLKKLAQFIDRIATVRQLAVLMLLALLFPALLFPAAGIGEAKPLDLYLYYSPKQAYAYFDALGAEGRDAYVRMELTTDLIFPVIYALALTVALVLVLRKRGAPAGRLHYLRLFPLLIVPADWCENLGLVVAMGAFPDRIEAAVIVAGGFTALKWALLIATGLMLVVAAVSAATRRFHSGSGG